MELAKLASKSAEVTAGPQAPRVGLSSSHTLEHDGITWLLRPGAEPVIRAVAGAQWRDPAHAGWTLVKKNGRRTVWRFAIDGRGFYVKYYREQGWISTLRNLLRPSACQAEWAGGLFALRHNIPAARPAAMTSGLLCGGRRCCVLVTEAIAPALPLNEFWENLDSDQDVARGRRDRAQLFELLGAMIARAHQAGFEHLDMHAGNILVQTLGPRRYRTAFVDLHSARLDRPVSDAAVVRNLSQLNQWFRRHSSIGDRLRFLRAYFRWRNEFETNMRHARPLGMSFRQLVVALVNYAAIHAERLWARRDRRLLRDSVYFKHLALGGWRCVVALKCKAGRPAAGPALDLDAAWWSQHLTDPLAWFDAQRGAPLKDSHSAQVARVLLPRGDGAAAIIAKRPLSRNLIRGLRRVLGPSRSRRGWRTANALLNRDIATARPLALLERRIGPLVLDSVLLTEAIPGARDLRAHLQQCAQTLDLRAMRALKQQLATQLVRLLRRLHEAGFTHRDCKADNILIPPAPGAAPLWIDMDGIRRSRSPDWRAALVRLHVSLLDEPSVTRCDRVRFLRAFLARFGKDEDWRTVWRALEAPVRAKRESAAARRAWKQRHYGRP